VRTWNGSPWYSGEGITVNYPVWAQYAVEVAAGNATREATGELKRFTLTRNTLNAEIPDGWPAERNEVLVDVIAPGGRTPAVIEAIWYPGCGYSVHETPLRIEEPRRLSEETKQGIRRKSLVRRMEAKATLFAAEMIAEALEAQPDYYGTKK
jgi:hypothetical protein